MILLLPLDKQYAMSDMTEKTEMPDRDGVPPPYTLNTDNLPQYHDLPPKKVIFMYSVRKLLPTFFLVPSSKGSNLDFYPENLKQKY